MIDSEVKSSLIGRTVTDVKLDQWKQSDDLFQLVTLYLNDGSMVVFRSVEPLQMREVME